MTVCADGTVARLADRTARLANRSTCPGSKAACPTNNSGCAGGTKTTYGKAGRRVTDRTAITFATRGDSSCRRAKKSLTGRLRLKNLVPPAQFTRGCRFGLSIAIRRTGMSWFIIFRSMVVWECRRSTIVPVQMRSGYYPW